MQENDYYRRHIFLFSFLSTCFKGEVCLRLGPSKTNLYHLLRLSFVSLLSPLFRGFFFFFFPFFYFSFILFFSFSCFSVLLPFPLNPHLFFFFCNPNPRIEDAATEVKAASLDATISLPRGGWIILLLGTLFFLSSYIFILQIEPILSGNLPPGFDSSSCRSVSVNRHFIFIFLKLTYSTVLCLFWFSHFFSSSLASLRHLLTSLSLR